MLPTKRIRSWMSFQNLWRTAMKCQISRTSAPSLWRTACETAACRNHAKQRPRTMPKCCLRNALGAEWASKTFGGRLWNVKYQELAPQAFGGPLAKPPNSSRIRAKTMRNSDHEQCRNVAYETHQKLASQAFGGPLAKQPNSSRIRAKSVEWASKTFGGPLWNVKHQKLASKAFGQPLPKQPNSSRIRVQTMRNSDHEQCRNVAYETH